MVMKDVIPGDR